MLVPDLEFILASRTKVRLLRALIHLGMPISGRHAARLAGVSPKAIEALDELVECGILTRRESTAQFLFTWNSSHYLAPVLVQLFSREQSKVSEIADHLRAAIGDRKDIVSAAFYGSVARGDNQLDSDLDLLVVMSGSERDEVMDVLLDEGERLRPIYGIRISLVLKTEESWREMVRNQSQFALSVIEDAKVFMGKPLAEFA